LRVESQVWLGRTMQALQQASVLTGPAVDGDQVRLTLEAVTTEELAHVWALFPNTSVSLRGHPVWSKN